MPEWRRRNTERAQQLRREATPAERRLWLYLSGSTLGGFKFSRQMQIGPFYCDFLCRSQRLAVELDGYSHEASQTRDASRDALLTEYGFRTIRFTNEQVFKNLEGVLVAIECALNAGPPPTPPASGRGARL